jgi:23S rRNA pseudouridine955/2504/2580 synthase
MVEFTVTNLEDGQKIEKYIRKTLSEAPLGFIYKAFRKKDIKINGHWVNKAAIVHVGDVVRVYVTDAQLEDFKKPRLAEKKPFPYEIIYEDKNVLIVNKPAGILVYGDEEEKRNTLTQKVLDYLYYKDEYDPNVTGFTPSPAHRLDRNTSGLVVFGKNDAALKELEELFKERSELDKRYWALCLGSLVGQGEINSPLKKNPSSGLVTVCPLEEGGKTALTKWKVLKTGSGYSLLECELVTGRTHQIRVHLASIGHPILGDGKYGNFEENRKFKAQFNQNYQFLHAYSLSFKNVDGVLASLAHKTFVAPLSKEKSEVLKTLGLL